MATSNDIIAAARFCIGTKWMHQGRKPNVGIDCVGIPLWCGNSLGIFNPPYEPPPYQREAHWEEFVGNFQEQCAEKDVREAAPGDILCFRQDKFPCHCGILTADGTFVHAFLLRKKVVEERYTDQWKRETRAVFSFPGVG